MAMATTDYCVLCYADTGIPCTTSMDRREHFMEEAGQMCRDCFHGMYPHVCECTIENIPVPNLSLPAYRIS